MFFVWRYPPKKEAYALWHFSVSSEKTPGDPIAGL